MAYKKVFYTRRYPPLAPIIASGDICSIIKKRKLEEVRVALESGQFEEQQVACSDTDEEESNASTSCTTNPRSNRVAGHETRTDAELQAQQLLLEAQAAADHAAVLARKAVEDELLKSIYAKLQEQQAAEAAEKLTERHDLEEKHAAASQQISEIQQRLEQLKEAKHDLVKQLKQAMQAEQAAKQHQVALQQQQQLQQLMQQQQLQWQQHHMQQQQPAYRGVTPLGIPAAAPQCAANLTPRPEDLTSPAGYGTGYTPGATPTGAHSSAVAGFTPRGGVPSPSVGAGSQWLFSTPAQPPPPPPPRQPPPPPQQPLSEYQLRQHISDPAIAGTHGPLHGSASQYSQPHQHQQHGDRGVTGWGQPPKPGDQQHAVGLQQHDGTQEQQQRVAYHLQSTEALGEQQPYRHSLPDLGLGRMGDAAVGTAAAAAATLSRKGNSGDGGFGSGLKSPSRRRHRDRDWHHHPYSTPDSPEEGEALPSPPPQHVKAMHPAAAAGHPSAGAAVGAALHAGLTARHHSSRNRAEITPSAAAEAGSGPARRTNTGSGYSEWSGHAGGGSLFAGSGFSADPPAVAERSGLLRTSSTGGGSSSHLLSPPSTGGNTRGAGGLARSASAALDGRPALKDMVGMGDREWGMEWDGSRRQRAQQLHHGVGGGVRGEDVWRGERRRSGNIDRFGEGDRRS